MAQSVKSRAVFRLREGGRKAVILVGGAAAALSAARASKAQDEGHSRSLLLGGPVPDEETPILIDPLLPRGELRNSPPPPDSDHSLCSLERPVCVHGSEPAPLKAAVEFLEAAYERVVFGAQRPIEASRQRPLHWHLHPRGPLQVVMESRFSRGFDRGWAYCQGGSPTQATADRCIHELTVAQLAPATAFSLRSAFARQQTWMLNHDPEVPALARVAQNWPESGLAGPLPPPDPTVAAPVPEGPLERELLEERAVILFDFLHDLSPHASSLDSAFYGLTLAATTTNAGALRFDAEPDLFDALRVSMGKDRARFARFLDQLSRDRFLNQSRGLGAPTTPRTAWEIESGSLPRSLALPRPLLPTGSSYLLLKKSQNQDWPTQVAFRVYCEAPVSYVWSVTRLDGKLLERSFVPIAFKESDPTVEQRVGELAGTEALLLTGTNVGGVDLTHPFDPDHGPHEAHGCMVAINALEIEDGGQ